MFQQSSLENLLEISRHPVFGPALRTLTICTHRWDPYLYRRVHGQLVMNAKVPSWWRLAATEEADQEEVAKRQAFRRQLEDHDFMVRSGRSAVLNSIYVAQAIAGLPNLQTVVLGNPRRPWGRVERQTGPSRVQRLGV